MFSKNFYTIIRKVLLWLELKIFFIQCNRGGSQIIWIAPSGGRDRPDPITGEWHPVSFCYYHAFCILQMQYH